ncbi:hypothetical protein P691DRAFT_791426 [Macrolepiota fuliginosa MF-IS2]|uniref:F-box domain-containing protein n=1 Tax=Macrolepiota fuliginosa MF-IS2 TaxID=1400762 RepID=A0A9P5XDS9_9AGAR|nr:hypothetical protein P691DRAFT_791426 [Macrolepiota fuliginosa MF-IS2]
MRRRLNELRAQTSVLPPETLSTISQYACALQLMVDEDDPHLPVVLGTISTRWRKVVYSTPSLWMHLIVTLENAQCTSHANLTLLQLYFENSGNQSISIRINLIDDESEYENDESKHEDDENLNKTTSSVCVREILKCIFKDHPTKLRAFFCDTFFFEWLPPFFPNVDANVGFPNLKRIHIGWAGLSPILASRGNADLFPLRASTTPRLNYISLMNCLPAIQIPHEQITVLILEDIRIDKCFKLLFLRPNLVDYHCKYPRSPRHSDGGPTDQHMTLSHLKCFGWAFSFETWDLALLTLLALPVLEHFRCENQKSGTGWGSEASSEDSNDLTQVSNLRRHLRGFFSRSPKLATFEGASKGTGSWVIREPCDYLPDSTEEVYLQGTTHVEAESCMWKLGCRSQDSGPPAALPRLKVLSLEGKFWLNPSGYFFHLLIMMLQLRRQGPPEERGDQPWLESLTLKHDMKTSPLLGTGSSEYLAELQNFVDGGLELVTTDRRGRDRPERFRCEDSIYY